MKRLLFPLLLGAQEAVADPATDEMVLDRPAVEAELASRLRSLVLRVPECRQNAEMSLVLPVVQAADDCDVIWRELPDGGLISQGEDCDQPNQAIGMGFEMAGFSDDQHTTCWREAMLLAYQQNFDLQGCRVETLLLRDWHAYVQQAGVSVLWITGSSPTEGANSYLINVNCLPEPPSQPIK